MSFVFYDTETTGTDIWFDQILQFGAIRTDDDLNEVDRFEIRCRLLPHVTPSPKALEVTGVNPLSLLSTELPSHYEAISEVHARLSDWSPSIFVGYNSIRFDESLLRQAFFQTLHPIYLTNTGGNTRADVLRMGYAVGAFAPNVMSIPIGESDRPVFKLDQLAPANGFSDHNAHDAMGDVEATIHMARLIKSRAPDVWERMITLSFKQNVLDLLRAEPVLCHQTGFPGGRPNYAFVTECGFDPTYDNSRAVFDLSQDPKPFLDLDEEQLTQEFGKTGSPLKKVRANAQPILMPLSSAPQGLRDLAPTLPTIEERALLIAESEPFRRRVGTALSKLYQDVEPSNHVEKQIYDGFPSNSDSARMRQFHIAPWEDRMDLVRQMQDQRFARIGQRLIYYEKPDLLSDPTKEKIRSDFSSYEEIFPDRPPLSQK
jgi:exodeoxyribonuclease-1